MQSIYNCFTGIFVYNIICIIQTYILSYMYVLTVKKGAMDLKEMKQKYLSEF